MDQRASSLPEDIMPSSTSPSPNVENPYVIRTLLLPQLIRRLLLQNRQQSRIRPYHLLGARSPVGVLLLRVVLLVCEAEQTFGGPVGEGI